MHRYTSYISYFLYKYLFTYQIVPEAEYTSIFKQYWFEYRTAKAVLFIMLLADDGAIEVTLVVHSRVVFIFSSEVFIDILIQ